MSQSDSVQAVLYLHFAAMGGDLPALLALGYRHMYGISVPKVATDSSNSAIGVAEWDGVREPVIYRCTVPAPNP